MNDNMVKGKWTELKGEIQQLWGKLSHDELDRTQGNIKAISGLIEQHYGEAKEAITEKLNSLFQSGEQKVADKTEDAKEKVRNFDAKSTVDSQLNKVDKH